jgi:hypothetical protein
MVVGFSRSKHIIKRGTTTLTSYSNPNWIAFRCSHNQISHKNCNFVRYIFLVPF